MAWWNCRSNSNATAIPYTGSLLDPTRWQTQYSPGAANPVAAEVGWSLDLPVVPGSIHYVVAAINRPLTKGITASFRVEASPDAAFNYKLAENNTCDAPLAGIEPYFQRAGDDLSGVGPMEFYRFFARGNHTQLVDLQAGAVTITVPFDPALWISVYGRPGSTQPGGPEAFAAALANCANVGFTFGGGCFSGHGVNLTAGSARLICTQFDIA